MEATISTRAGREERGRVERTRRVLARHRPSIALVGKCSCGFTYPASETADDHRARMIYDELFRPREREQAQPQARTHEGNAANLAMHRARKEPPCGACLDYLDDALTEARPARIKVGV